MDNKEVDQSSEENSSISYSQASTVVMETPPMQSDPQLNEVPDANLISSSEPSTSDTSTLNQHNGSNLNEARVETSTDEEDGEDDESTIAAEEALGQDMTAEEELRLLKEDLYTPLHQLSGGRLTRYQSSLSSARSAQGTLTATASASSSVSTMSATQSEPSSTIDLSTEAEDEDGAVPAPESTSDTEDDPSALAQFYEEHIAMDGTYHHDPEEDTEFIPRMPVNPEIHIGEEYQADVPLEMPSQSSPGSPSQGSPRSEELIWRPSAYLSDDDVAAFIEQVMALATFFEETGPIDQFALQTLMRCGYVTSTALEHVENYLRKKNEQQPTNPNENSSDEDLYETPNKKPKK